MRLLVSGEPGLWLRRRVGWVGVLCAACGADAPADPVDATSGHDSGASDPTPLVESAPTTDTGPLDGTACAGGLPWRTVPVRFHLVQSTLPSLDATWTEQDLLPVLETTQALWAQACLRVELESTVRSVVTEAQEQAYLEALEEGTAGREREVMTAAMPEGQRLDPGWNVMVFPSFAPVAPASGLFLFETGDILFAEQTPSGAPNPLPIFAHELGHSLGLGHHKGPDASSNLMTASIGTDHPTATELRADQIDTARAQAAAGRPTSEPP